MANKEKFKDFVAKNPSFATYVNSGNMSWQKFYEMYDLYGEENSVWDSYRKINDSSKSVSKINDLIKNVDMDAIKEHISSAQKALDFVQELTTNKKDSSIASIVSPRPLNKFFED